MPNTDSISGSRETWIERIIERRTDRHDKAFMNGDITQEQYDNRIAADDAWAASEYDNNDDSSVVSPQ